VKGECAHIEGKTAKLLGRLTEGDAAWSMNVGVPPLGSGFGVVNLPETRATPRYSKYTTHVSQGGDALIQASPTPFPVCVTPSYQWTLTGLKGWINPLSGEKHIW